MRFLPDVNASGPVGEFLSKEGHDVRRVSELGLQDAEDEKIFEKPSVILFRKGSERDPHKQIEPLQTSLGTDIRLEIFDLRYTKLQQI